MKRDIKTILSVVLITVTAFSLMSCSPGIYVPYEEVFTVTRTPLNEKGATMNVRISDEPGEDPFYVAPGACPDPFVMYDSVTDYYYGLCTQNSYIMLHRSRKLADLFTGDDALVVYSTGKEVLESMWAPEMYFINGKWYIYSSGKIDREDDTKRLFVLESETSDPFGGFHFKAYLSKDIFGIDPTLYLDKSHGKNYICFSQVIDGLQWLSIAELSNPWTMKKVTPISDPHDYAWESLGGVPLNEGAFFVSENGRLFIIYSANGCYSDYYRLGLLELKGSNLLSKDSWEKYPEDIFRFSKDDGIYAPGHASFFSSPDGTELWIAYHCYYSSNKGDRRRMRICQVQPVAFDETGFPVIGKPLANGTLIPVPSGE